MGLLGKLRSFANVTSIHGLPDLMKTTRMSGKIVWTTALIIAGVLFSIQVAELCSSYHGEETGTVIKPWAPTAIPGINFCPAYYLQNRKTMNSLNTSNDFETTIINMYMDGFLSFGSVLKMFLGKTNVKEEGSEEWQQLLKLAAAFTQNIADKYGLLRKYNYNISKFMSENSINEKELFTTIFISPLNVTYTIENDLSWLGPCFHLNFNAEVSKFQLQFIQIDVHTNPLSDGELPDMDLRGVGYVPNSMYLRVGERSHEGVSLPYNSEIHEGNEIYISITPMRVERIPLRRKPCRDYSQAGHTHCLMDYERKKCTQCKTMFPQEKLSGEGTECNYMLSNGFCPIESIERLNLHNVDAFEACPEPCIIEEYSVVLGTPKPLISGSGTLLHFTFRGITHSIKMSEYELVTTAGLLSNFGGTMGLYFGASMLSLVHMLYYFFGGEKKRPTSDDGDVANARRQQKKSLGCSTSVESGR